MPSAENAILYYEAGQTANALTALNDSGDHTKYNSPDELWSANGAYAPEILPNGITTGGAVTPESGGASDQVDVAELICNLAGVETTVAADEDVAVARPDATYVIITLAAGGYTECVAADIGKTVTDDPIGDTGTLIAYNNTTRQWVIDQTDTGDLFDDDDATVSIGTGTGAGTMSGAGVMATHKIVSITVNSSGAIAAVVGTEGLAFSETRGAIGGPPWIPTTSIEIAQVRYSTAASAAIAASEIFAVEGTHKEMALFPGWTIKYSRVTNNVQGYAGVDMDSALPLIHSDNAGTATATKKIYATWYEPTFSELPKSTDFKPPANSKSVSSTQVYGGTIGSVSSSLGQGGFTAYLTDGITDGFLAREGQNLFFKFKQDRLKDPFILSQGYLGITQTFPAGNSISAACTISAEVAAQRVNS
jgi:hypothetical protein